MDSISNKSNDEILVSYVQKLEEDNKRLQEELEAKSKPKVYVDFTRLTAIWDSDSELFNTLFAAGFVISIICGIILTIYHVWPSTYETGRFYLNHTMHDYDPPENCPGNAIQRYTHQHECVKNAVDVDSCYMVVREVENGQDDIMSKCIRNKGEAYTMANEFTREWKILRKEGGLK
jgi:hypothetical protein